MADALDFLKSVADAQFEHEKNFLQEEVNKLSKIDSQNQTYKNIINFLQTSPDKLDYFKLTKYLNQCLQDIDAAEQRLKNISDVNKAKNSKDFEAIRNATAGLESLISDFTHQRFEFKKSNTTKRQSQKRLNTWNRKGKRNENSTAIRSRGPGLYRNGDSKTLL